MAAKFPLLFCFKGKIDISVLIPLKNIFELKH